MDYAIAHSAVVVSPNYRLLPESTGIEIMEDLSDFWQWTRSGLQALVSSSTDGRIEVDLSKTLVQGESSGVLCSSTLRDRTPKLLRRIYFRGLSCYPIGPHAASFKDQSNNCFVSND